jgi:hypothetical protein
MAAMALNKVVREPPLADKDWNNSAALCVGESEIVPKLSLNTDSDDTGPEEDIAEENEAITPTITSVHIIPIRKKATITANRPAKKVLKKFIFFGFYLFVFYCLSTS